MRAGATLYVVDLEPMARFYTECLGFVRADDLDGLGNELRILESTAWTLTIVQIGPELAGSIHLADPPVRRAMTPVKLTFDVPGIAAVRPLIVDHGGRVDPGEWDFQGSRYCDFVDPEGNVGQLREARATGG